MATKRQYPTDPIVLSAQARAVLETLHKHDDIVVKFKTNDTGYKEDELDELDNRVEGGHYKPGQKLLTINLDKVITKNKPSPVKLDSLEDFRQYPVLAGVAAHESGHARWSLWQELPESIPNPDFDPFADPDDEGENPTGPETFRVSGNGKLIELAQLLEEPRIERLGSAVYTKTWRRAMSFSAGHLILDKVEEMDENRVDPLDSAVRLAVIVGGRLTAGTLGSTHESRVMVKKVLDSAREIIEQAVSEQEDPTPDPYEKIMGIINKEIFSNDHEDAVSHLEAARQILKIVHPDESEDPDGDGSGSGGAGAGEEGEGEGEEGSEEGLSGAMKAMADAMKEAMDDFAVDSEKLAESEAENPDKENTKSTGHGSTLFKNPNAPQIARYEQPNAEDRELYRRALDWMEKQIEPSITEFEMGQWLPTGGARLNLRSHIRDNMAGHRGSQRTDWDRVSETVKPRPPVKVGIMLDGSGSMGSMARPSASIAWAASNAAAMLPESRTVSVVYGDAAQVTQQPGHLPARQIAVSNTNGGTEEFIEAAKMVEDALWLNDPIEEGEHSNTLIIIVSDLAYYGRHKSGESQKAGFARIMGEWDAKGYQIVVVGASSKRVGDMYGSDTIDLSKAGFEIKTPTELFR